MCFRVVVRTVEAWLLADRERIARFLRVSPARIPTDPESIADPKNKLVQVAACSRSRDIREDLVPRPGSKKQVGPAYTSRLIEFILDSESGWRPRVAPNSADSLRRTLACLERLKVEVGQHCYSDT